MASPDPILTALKRVEENVTERLTARIKALEAVGVTQTVIQVVSDGREMIEEFSREVIAKY